MSQKTYRAAVIGLGMIGGADQESADKLGQSVAKMDGTHTGAYMKNPRVKIVAGADPLTKAAGNAMKSGLARRPMPTGAK